MKIAIIMPLAEQRGGAEIALIHLMQQGQDLGVEWLVIFLQDGPMVDQVRQLGARVQVVETGRLREPHRFLAAISQIAKLARREDVQALFGWMGIAQLYGGVAGMLADVPAIWYQHGIPRDKNWIYRAATRLPALGILTCSQAVADAQALIGPKRPLRVVHPGAKLERFQPELLPAPSEARRKLGLPSAGPLIGIAGRLQRWKGMHVLVEAMPEVLRAHPDVHCVLVGGDHALELDYPAFLQERIETLGMQEKVMLTGLQRNIPKWMQAMDVIIHASDHEPFGIVIVEAMALGKPVVAGNAAGPTEIITDGTDGLLTPYGDANALAQAVLQFLDRPDFARQLGMAARRRAQVFSTQCYAESCVAALHSLLSASESRP